MNKATDPAGNGWTPLPPEKPAPGTITIRGKTVSTKVFVVALLAVLVVGATAISAASAGGDGGSHLIPPHKTMVDNLAADGDCGALQARFDAAYENRGTAGSEKALRNAALMEYANDAMKRIGCFG